MAERSGATGKCGFYRFHQALAGRNASFPITAKLPLFPRGARQSVGKECAMTTFINMLRDEAGASAAEYALILAIVGAAIAVAAVLLGGAISTAMNDARSCIENPPSGGATSC
jgi:pilus assembly protein Flp/PilA